MQQSFKKEVLLGLKSNPKKLPSKYFYDKTGDAIFIKIMQAPEYYLTNAEHEIFKEKHQEIVKSFQLKDHPVDVFELGAGDGTKTIELLQQVKDKNLIYKPIDISINALSNLKNRLKRQLPQLQVATQQGEYFKVLKHLDGEKRKVILFLGSNLGNMEDAQAKLFLQQLADVMQKGDLLLLGLDLKKSKDIVLPAYNDAAGHTRDFNLNLLQRINDQLNANFNLNAFEHAPEYNEQEGIAKSYLVSLAKQEVTIDQTATIKFEAGERIFMEISRKYDDEILNQLLADTQLAIVNKFLDSKQYFCDYLIEKQ